MHDAGARVVGDEPAGKDAERAGRARRLEVVEGRQVPARRTLRMSCIYKNMYLSIYIYTHTHICMYIYRNEPVAPVDSK